MDQRVGKGKTTRGRILEVATELFTAQGYEAASVEAVLKASGVSRGALYHHFPSKEALFAATLEDVEARVAERLAKAGQGAVTPLDALLAGCGAWLDLALDPQVSQIVLKDAPSVVGWAAWRELDAKYALGLLKAGVAAAGSADLSAEAVEVYAHLLLAMLVEGALLIANTADPELAMPATRAAIEKVVRRLLAKP